MYRIIDGNNTGKTRKLLTECGINGIFVCYHPERMNEKCGAYNIPQVNAIGYDEFWYRFQKGELDGPIYIDELEKCLQFAIPSLTGYTITNED